MKTIYLMCGIPGIGKSSWLAANRKQENSLVVSRDVIRKKMVGGDAYFSKEKEVFNAFVQQIKDAINSSFVEYIYIDATHVNKAGRAKVLNRLDLAGCRVIAVDFGNDVNKALIQNELRFQDKFAYVPSSAIENMAASYEAPTAAEHGIDEVLKVF